MSWFYCNYRITHLLVLLKPCKFSEKVYLWNWALSYSSTLSHFLQLWTRQLPRHKYVGTAQNEHPELYDCSSDGKWDFMFAWQLTKLGEADYLLVLWELSRHWEAAWPCPLWTAHQVLCYKKYLLHWCTWQKSFKDWNASSFINSEFPPTAVPYLLLSVLLFGLKQQLGSCSAASFSTVYWAYV